jgi:putative spermidine/putrescine transport system ATP-binding protein/spermidine/putrescine transport system ATP-binding protein
MLAERLPAIAPASPPEPTPGARRRALQVDGVTKRFGSVTALEETWLKIEKGEFVTLLGPSGCGKTTLLNLVAGFLQADGGEIFIDGTLVTEVPTREREIGIVFQNYALFPHMSVAKNIGYGLRMRGVPRREIAERVDAALAMVKLSGFGDRYPRQLSGGQQQRVALARALVIRPKVLLLDEPFSALDKHLRASMQVELKEIQRRLEVTTIFVTHDQSEALSMSDRIAVMSQGRIRQIGTPDEIYRRPNDPFVASFVGDVSVLSGTLTTNGTDRPIALVGNAPVKVGGEALAALPPGAQLDIYVRPEHLRLVRGEVGISGRVAAQVYQGGYVDLYVDSEHAALGRFIVRIPEVEAHVLPPAGSPVNVSLPESELVAFPSCKSE